MNREHVDLSPVLSKAVHVTVVLPSGNEVPLAGEHDVFLTPEPSVAVTVYVATAELIPPGLRFWLAGHVMAGGAVSTTDTAKLGHALVFPALSLAEQAMLVVPRLKVEPDAGLHAIEATPELSTAAKTQVAVLVGVLPLVGDTTKGVLVEYGGHVKVGFVLSMFVMVNEHMLILLALSVVWH